METKIKSNVLDIDDDIDKNHKNIGSKDHNNREDKTKKVSTKSGWKKFLSKIWRRIVILKRLWSHIPQIKERDKRAS